jgi:hypothetical protein
MKVQRDLSNESLKFKTCHTQSSKFNLFIPTQKCITWNMLYEREVHQCSSWELFAYIMKVTLIKKLMHTCTHTHTHARTNPCYNWLAVYIRNVLHSISRVEHWKTFMKGKRVLLLLQLVPSSEFDCWFKETCYLQLKNNWQLHIRYNPLALCRD